MDGLKMSRFGHFNPFSGANKGKQRKDKTRKVKTLTFFTFPLLSFVLSKSAFFVLFLKPDF